MIIVKGLGLVSILFCSMVIQAVAITDFISSLSDRVNEIKQAVLNSHNQARSSKFSTHSSLITDRFVSRDPSHVRFLLYNKRLSPNEFRELRIGAPDTFHGMRRNKQLKILIHGFNHNSTDGPGAFPSDAKNAYLEYTDNNVIVVDWGKLAKPTVSGLTTDVFYPIVVSNVPRVGEEIGRLIEYILDNGIIAHPDLIHVIGFSLGAHVAGATGSYVRTKMDRFIGRITGLDPAAPMFEQALDVERLDKTDADFVDVIHSSRLGLYDRLGHVDFYVNGGRFQADCYKVSERTPRETLLDLYKAIMGSCGHSRAPLYYIHSIKTGPGAVSGCGCSGWREYLTLCKNKCKGIVEFGEFCPPTARGMYFLEITADHIKS